MLLVLSGITHPPPIPKTVKEVDGDPEINGVNTWIFSNGSVSASGDGEATITTGAGGGGDFSSSVSSTTDNSVVRMDGTGGKTGQDSNLIINDLTDTASQEFLNFNGSDRTTAADGDDYYLTFSLEDTSGSQNAFIRLTVEANDVTNGSEDGEMIFSGINAGTLAEFYRF